MKPKKNPARVMYGDPAAFDNSGNPFAFKPVLYAKRSTLHSRAFVVIPTATAKQARQIVRFFNLTEGEQRERIGVIIQRWMNGYALPAKHETVAVAVLGAIHGGAK